MSIVSDILKAQYDLLTTHQWSGDFAYIIAEDRVQAAATELAMAGWTDQVTATDIEQSIRAGTFSIFDIPVIVRPNKMVSLVRCSRCGKGTPASEARCRLCGHEKKAA